MSSSSGTGNFVEINDHAVIAIRTSLANGSIRIETWREIGLQNRMEAAEAMRAVFPEGTSESPVSVHCAVRPAQRFFKIASADESKQHNSAAAARGLVASGLPAGFEPAEIACLYAGDGRLLGGGAPARWLAAAAPRESLDAASAMLTEWNLKATRIEPAAFSFLGASCAALANKRIDEPLAIWDASANHSDLFLVTSSGVEATRRIDFGFEQVFDALLTEIQLKFKGAAVRLFFNDRYDFTDAGPKIAGRVAASLQEAVAALALQAGGRMPTSFVCSSFPSKQSWFNTHLSSALHLNRWSPSVSEWLPDSGVTFADASLAESLSQNALGALNLVAGARQRPDADAWHAAWIGGATEAAPKAATPPAAPAKATPPPAPVAAKAAAPVAAKAPTPPTRSTPTPAKATPAPVPVAAKAAPAAVAEASRSGKKAPVQTPAFPSPSKKKAEEEVAVKAPAAVAAAPAPKKSGNKNMLWMGIAAAVVVFGGGFFAYNMVAEQKATALREKQAAEQRATELAEANREAELKAQAEAEARRQAEEAAAAQLKAAQDARARAELEAAQAEADRERLINARGSLVIKTEPNDATVTVGNLAPRVSPAAFHDLRLGRYTVEVTKPGYDPVTFEVDIKENDMIDRGVIPLVRQSGSLAIESTPAGAAYFVQRTGEVSFSLESTSQFRGVTPANLTDLPTGDYSVRLERAGWAPVTKTVTIDNKGTVRVTETFNGGTVKIASIPEGAEVFANNVSIGRTPVTLPNVSPGEVTYRVEMADHIPATTSGTVEPEKALNLTTFLVPIEKLARIADLDSPPKPVKTVEPKLEKDASKFRGERVLISVVIDENGEPRDWRILETPDDALADICIEAIAQWRFQPAMSKGRPVKVRVTVPLMLN